MFDSKYAIWDLDNCLSDDRARIPLIDWAEYPTDQCWDAYHDACDQDPPGVQALERFRLVHNEATQVVPLFFTARPERLRTKTVAWLRKHLNIDSYAGWRLLMRSAKDHRRSRAVKDDMLRLIRLPIDDCVGAFDDQQDIIDMYRSAGIRLAERFRIHGIESHAPPPKEPARDLSMEQFAVQTAEMSGLAGQWPVQGAKPAGEPPKPVIDAAARLRKMAELFERRNADYKDNYKMVAPIMRALFPAGVPQHLVTDDRWHLFELTIVKLTRFAVSQLSHRDSAQDAAVYLAMIDAINEGKQAPK